MFVATGVFCFLEFQVLLLRPVTGSWLSEGGCSAFSIFSKENALSIKSDIFEEQKVYFKGFFLLCFLLSNSFFGVFEVMVNFGPV